jgi:hypothetical protein
MLTEQLDFEIRISIHEAGFHITIHSSELSAVNLSFHSGKGEGIVKFTQDQATKAQRGSRL